MEKILHHQRCPKIIFQPHKKRISGTTSGAGFFHQPYDSEIGISKNGCLNPSESEFFRWIYK